LTLRLFITGTAGNDDSLLTGILGLLFLFQEDLAV